METTQDYQQVSIQDSQALFDTEQELLPFFKDYMKNQKHTIQLIHDDKEIECPICKKNYPSSQICEFSCFCQHQCCYVCLKNSIQTYIEKKEAPRCIQCNNIKQIIHKLSSDDIRQVFSMDPESTPEIIQQIIDTFEKQVFEQFKCDYITHCPSCMRVFYRCPTSIHSSVEHHCKDCNFTFCSYCLKPYHYGKKCDEYTYIESCYLQWKLNLRHQRMIERKHFFNQTYNFEQAEYEYEKEKILLETNIKTFEESEKLRNSCIGTCPNCHILVERKSGCNIMTCGLDYHDQTSKQRYGCGYIFKMEDTIPYMFTTAKEDFENFKNKLPSVKDNVQHSSCFKCDICKKPISGIRFICANCPSLYLCEDCEYDRIQEHFNGKHVFRMTVDPNEK